MQKRKLLSGLTTLAVFSGFCLAGPAAARAEGLGALLSDVTTSAAHRYGTHDSAGRTLDGLKIQEAEPGEYLGVSHTDEGGTFNVYLERSSDLLHWTPVRRLDSNASQPTLEPDGRGGWLFGDEVTRRHGGNYLRFRHFTTTRALKAGNYDAQFQPPNTLAGTGGAQGTPNFYNVRLRPDIAHSVIQVGFHYYSGRDRQATGTLTNFSSWSAHALRDLDAEFKGAKGNIGDRDFFQYRGHPYAMHEAQLTSGNWGAWRVWLRDRAGDSVSRLDMHTHGGSRSFGNPTVTMLKLPNGAPGFVETDFIFGSGAARGEGGELVFYKRLPGRRCTITGTPGPDTLQGTARRDAICGLGGRDKIRGGGGDDSLIGGKGDDLMIGGPGDDRITGGSGSDELIGGGDPDILRGGMGRDSLCARDGHRHDFLSGGRGVDRYFADPGDVTRGVERVSTSACA